jgi:cytochrome bd-type quinol oxidase subunit 1
MLAAAPFDILDQIMPDAVADPASRFTTVQNFFYALANTVLTIAFGLSIVAIAFAFIQMSTSVGDIKNTERAQRTLIWGGIGFVVSIGGWMLKEVLINAAGLSGLD